MMSLGRAVEAATPGYDQLLGLVNVFSPDTQPPAQPHSRPAAGVALSFAREDWIASPSH